MQHLKNLQKFWAFRNKQNFLICFTGITSTGYFIARYSNESKFDHPVVKESTRLLQKNNQLIELLGYPIVVETGIGGSRALIYDDKTLFTYKAKGPKGYVQIELEGEALTHKEVKQIGVKQQEQENQQEKNTDLIIDEQLQQQAKKEYYILDPEAYKELEQFQSQQQKQNQIEDKEGLQQQNQQSQQEEKQTNFKEIPIKDDLKFWKITNLHAELGGQYRISIVPGGKSPIQDKAIDQKKEEVDESTKSEVTKQLGEKKKSKKEIEQELKQKRQEKINLEIQKNSSQQLSLVNSVLPYFQPTNRQNMNDLLIEEQRRKGKEAKADQLQNLSDEELEEMRKFNQQQLYKKLGYIRFYMVLVVLGGGMMAYSYMMKNKRINIVGSQIHMQTNQYIQRHPFVKKEFGRKIRFTDSLRGAQIGNKAEFQNDFYGERIKGIAKVIGEYNEDNKQWKIQNLDVEIYNFNGDLLKKQKLI